MDKVSYIQYQNAEEDDLNSSSFMMNEPAGASPKRRWDAWRAGCIILPAS